MGCIYICTNSVNGKQYVGQTRYTLALRKRQHITASNRPNNLDFGAFHQAIAKYGSDKFVWEELCDVADNEYDTLNELETLAIEMNQTRVPAGYNILTGGKHQHGSGRGKRKRLDDTLPKYVYRIKEGFAVTHPASGQSTSFVRKGLTEDEKLNAAVEWLRNAEAGNQMPKRRKLGTRTVSTQTDFDGLPKHIQRFSRGNLVGYRAKCPRTKKERLFASSKISLASKLQAAEAWLADQASGIGCGPKKRGDRSLPKYMIYTKCHDSFVVIKPGFPKKSFGRSFGTHAERLDMAKQYLQECD